MLDSGLVLDTTYKTAESLELKFFRLVECSLSTETRKWVETFNVHS